MHFFLQYVIIACKGGGIMQIKELFEKELKSGCKNSAVFGGFADFLAKLAAKHGLEELQDLASCYAVASTSERRRLMPMLEEMSASIVIAEEPRPQAVKAAADTYRSNLNMPITYLKSIGAKRAALLKKMGINTVEELLFYFPRYFKDKSVIASIGSLPIADSVNIRGRIARTEELRPKPNMSILKAWISDGTGHITAVWFNQKFLKAELYEGRELFISGKTSYSYRQLQINVSEYEFLSDASSPIQSMQPVYALTEGISQKVLRGIINDTLQKYSGFVEENLPQDIMDKLHLPSRVAALRAMHCPQSAEEYETARRRFAYEELLILQLAINSAAANAVREGRRHSSEESILQDFCGSLPFTLTNAQQRVIGEIFADMQSSLAMARMCCGDVGCGKTVVAAAAIYLACRSGHQAALMAPTEILAAQHYQALQPLLQHLGISCCLITGSVNGKAYDSLIKALESGEMQVAIGTQALIQDNVKFKDLSLAIVDEQHRFGVRQRTALLNKGIDADLLVMTATPIPRSLALAFYSDLRLSVIDEMPPGRLTVKTYAVGYDYEPRIWAFLEKEMQKGRQCFVVCPLVEESEKLDLESATELYEQLQKQYANHRIGLLHGRLKAEEKDCLMQDFAEHNLDLLVATTVIEVGIDIPNATVMLVRAAERFGLAQLHQLRGRIGRGKEQSYCVLMHNAVSPIAKERIKIMVESNDGFKLAEADLRLRGPGEFFGTRQHGVPELQVADLFNDAVLLEAARRDALTMLAQSDFYKKDAYALLNAQLKQKQQALN